MKQTILCLRPRVGAFCLALTLFAGALWGCGNGSSAPLNQLFAPLRGTQERPTQVATSATGAVTVTFNSANTGLNVQISTQNLAGVTSAELHVGQPGTTGPAIFTLYTATSSSSFSSGFSKDLTSANLTVQPSANINSLTDAINAINAGSTYINISTQQNPTGELRGQIGPAQVTVTLNGAAVVPAVAATTSATSTVSLNPKQSVLVVTFNGQNLQHATHIGVYAGVLGGNGPQLFSVFDSKTDGVFSTGATGSVTRSFTATDLQKQTVAPAFSDAVNAFLSGNTYIQVSTSDHTDGELRAQLTAQQTAQ